MLKICTVLFVASMATSVFAQATNPTELVDLLEGYRHINPEAKATAADPRRSPAPDLARVCPHLPQLRSTNIETALHMLYQANGFAPIWNDQPRLVELRSELAGLADDGLEPAEYSLGRPLHGATDRCIELHTSSNYLLALEHLGSGRLDQQAHEPMWHEENAAPPSPPVGHWARRGLDDLSAAFEQARPDLELYRDLRAAYIRLRDEPPEHRLIATGDLIRPGDTDPRVPMLAARLIQEGYLGQAQPQEQLLTEATSPLLNPEPAPQPATTLDPDLTRALEQFQQNHGLTADGVLGPNTLAALNMPPGQRLQLARINLERLRWISALLLDDTLLVNNAQNHLRHYRNGRIVWQTRIISGRPTRETPSLVSRLNRITLNPDWTVPPTIRREDMLPEIRRDLAYLKRRNLQVIDYQGNRLDPETIDWYAPRGLMIRQPPGPRNPLGQVIFRFPNPFAVYLHDTPDKYLFSRVQRNLSSGCVRVESAGALADTLFSRMDTARQQRVEQLRKSSSTHQLAVTDGPQVVLGYWTAEADAQGQLRLAQDPYGRDPALIKALAGAQRGTGVR